MFVIFNGFSSSGLSIGQLNNARSTCLIVMEVMGADEAEEADGENEAEEAEEADEADEAEERYDEEEPLRSHIRALSRSPACA